MCPAGGSRWIRAAMLRPGSVRCLWSRGIVALCWGWRSTGC
nr:MAG TPA: hypothetical protein [Caudoviricetes sp.]